MKYVQQWCRVMCLITTKYEYSRAINLLVTNRRITCQHHLSQYTIYFKVKLRTFCCWYLQYFFKGPMFEGIYLKNKWIDPHFLLSDKSSKQNMIEILQFCYCLTLETLHFDFWDIAEGCQNDNFSINLFMEYHKATF